MEDKILDCVKYVKNISKQKLRERRSLHIKMNDESVSQKRIQNTIDALIGVNQKQEKQEIVTKS